MYNDVDHCGTSAAGANAYSELFAALPAEAARVASGEAPAPKRSGIRSCTGLAG